MPMFVIHKSEGRYLSYHVLGTFYSHRETEHIALAVAFVYEFWFFSTQFGAALLQIYINSLYLQTMSTSMNGLRLRASCLITNQFKRRRMMLMTLRAYPKLRILSTLYNETIGQHFLARFKSCLGICTVGAAFIFIKLLGMKDILITTMGGSGVIVAGTMFYVLAKLCSKVHSGSIQLQTSLQAQKLPERKIHKQMACYKVIAVNIGSFYIVKRSTPLTMLGMISNTTMTTLISVNFST
ncbi:unnamed protein product [Orchesella dallaii]